MSIEDRISDMLELTYKLADISSQLEDGTSLLEEWKGLADKYTPADIEGFISRMEEWDSIEGQYGDSAEVEEKLGQLDDWVEFEEEYGTADDIRSKVEELEAVVHKVIEDCGKMSEKYAEAIDKLEALKSRSRWQTLLSLFTGGN